MIQSVQKALQILDVLHENVADMGVTELSKATGLYKSTCHRILATLKESGYVEQSEQTGKFRLGWRLFQLGASLPERVRLTDVARPEMVKLAGTCGESINLAIRSGRDALFVDRVSGDALFRPEIRIGTRLPAHATGVGKVLLAWLSTDVLKGLYESEEIPPVTPSSIIRRTDLFTLLSKVQKDGYALDLEESGAGIGCLAVPIRDHTGAVAAALSITFLASRMSELPRDENAALLKRHAETISRALGYRPAT